MALPLTGITTSMVASAIGEASNDVGALFLSNKVNQWGFNCPETNLQNAIWGKPPSERAKLSPSNAGYVPILGVKPGYHLGAFRRYDHNWMTYMSGGIDMTADNYEDPLVFKLYIEPVPPLTSKPHPSPAIEHTFKIEFARNEMDFDPVHGSAIVIDDNFIATYPYSTFQFDADTPPDYSTNGSLDEGEVFYIKVTHLSSPERRWDDLLVAPIIESFTTPQSSFTNTMSYENFLITAIKKTTTPALTLFKVEADLYADFDSQQIFTFTGKISDDPYFVNNVFSQTSGNIVVQRNTTPGTKTFVTHLSFDLSGSGIDHYVDVGDTVYGRITANTGQLTGGNTVVVDEIPIIQD